MLILYGPRLGSTLPAANGLGAAGREVISKSLLCARYGNPSVKVTYFGLETNNKKPVRATYT